jgi:hypothetical protein
MENQVPEMEPVTVNGRPSPVLVYNFLPAPVKIFEFLHIFFDKPTIKVFFSEIKHFSLMSETIFIIGYSADYSIQSEVIVKYMSYCID